MGYILSSSSSATVGSSTECYKVGGLVGTNLGVIGVTSGGAPAISYATGSVAGKGSTAAVLGGLVGDNTNTIQYSYATGSVSGHGFLGGLVGENGDTGNDLPIGFVDQSFAIGAVTDTGGDESGSYSYGGLVGTNAPNGKIKDSYAEGAVESATCTSCNVGGFVGQNQPPDSTVGATNLKNAYEIGYVYAPDTACVGGFVGSNDASGASNSVKDAYWDTDTSHTTDGWGTGSCSLTSVTGISPKTSDELMGGFQDGFLDTVWKLDPSVNSGFPSLIYNPQP